MQSKVFTASSHIILIISFNTVSSAGLDILRYVRHPYRADRYDEEPEEFFVREMQLEVREDILGHLKWHSVPML